jgi:hypothetical protein
LDLAWLGQVIWRGKSDAHAWFLELMRAPGRPGEPQSTGSEQHRNGQGQMFCFHSFCFDHSFTFNIATALCVDFPGLSSDLEPRRGILVQSARKQE